MSHRSATTQYADDVSTATPRTGGEAVAAALERAGVEHLFGVQGGAIMPVYDALYDSTMGHVTMAHERSAAHAAHAYGVVSGTPGVCLATSGPGATNLVTGLADAAANDAPLLALTGQAPSHLIGRDAFQEAPTVDVTGPVTKANYLVTDVDVVGDTVAEAFALARAGRPGPTLVDLPKDVTLATTDRSPTAPSPSVDSEAPERVDPESVSAAAEALAGADRPVVLSGRGVIAGDASAELRAFVTAHGIPVATTVPGLGSFPEDHPLSLSVAGTHGTACANRALANCDAVLAVGADFDGSTGGVETVAPDAESVHLDATGMPRADHPLVGDVGTALEQLFDAMPRSPDAAAWRGRTDAWRRESAPDDAPADGPLTPRAVVERLDELTPDDTLVTTGGGRHQWWAMRYWTFRRPRTWLSTHLGTMGYGLPAAIGACVATGGDRPVVCIEGADSFLTTQQELAVAVREALDLTVVVLHDATPGSARTAPHRAGDPQFDVLADVFGARGFRLNDPDGVERTLEAALAVDGPSVVDVHLDPEVVPAGDDL
ncbi:thiamine pyrophosphate-binding protein [Haloplanus aerogenes]|uniref:Acetolactate synthase-1/2/3 large subunit n=1 Tax=Haloplanus aerogenes TaxID=660522 RepID=A0A3M0D0Q1_9EURY|nr:thiamine pyrophosphate-binding protein [Haloplanus aerogenes]AZH24049.1 thiamine pyrophosphate-binding protein [Haloplanus aerogenes]RMB13176.1 acetolactate synthase-1/2/3 large subunit [Haloplanus aerogenes]